VTEEIACVQRMSTELAVLRRISNWRTALFKHSEFTRPLGRPASCDAVSRDNRLYLVTLPPYVFTLQPEEISAISAVQKVHGDVFLCLVCGTMTVRALNDQELDNVLDLSSKVPQWVHVDIPKRRSCHVSGSRGKLRPAVTHSSFPDKLFASYRASKKSLAGAR
jgi:hypothetical protein